MNLAFDQELDFFLSSIKIWKKYLELSYESPIAGALRRD
jgi:hypothetical protein